MLISSKFESWNQITIAAILSVIIVEVSSTAFADFPAKNPRNEIGFDQKLGQSIPLDLVFSDENGETVELRDYFGKKPVILMPVYYKCPMLCGLELNGMVRCLRGLKLSTGMMANQDFEILTYSIDPRETSGLAANKRKQYLAQYNVAEANDGWHFLAGNEESIQKLNQVIGFRAKFDEITGHYAHASGFVVCTPEGVISRYLFGVEFAPRDLRLAVVESSAGKVGPSIAEHVLLFCYRYDPSTGRYGLAIMNLLRAGGVLTVLILGTAITMMLRRDKAVAESHKVMEGTSHG